MRELDLPSMIRGRVEFYNNLWGKKARGEDLSSFSHLVSDSFDRTVVFDLSKDDNGDQVPDLHKGKLVFADKKCDLTIVAEIEGSLEDLRYNVDTDKLNKDFSIFEFCQLNGMVHFETPSVILKGFYRGGKTAGGFYQHTKANKLPGEKGPKDGTIIQTVKQLYDCNGRRHGLWYTEKKTYRECVRYDHGELLPDSRTVKYFMHPKTRTQKLIDKLLSIGFVANIARFVSKRRTLKNTALFKGNANQGR